MLTINPSSRTEVEFNNGSGKRKLSEEEYGEMEDRNKKNWEEKLLGGHIF